MDRIRFLLASDLHLGSQDCGKFSGSHERMSTFRKICGLAMKHDILLLAGDMIHSDNIPSDLFSQVNSELKQLADNNVEVYYTPGKGELAGDNTVSPAVTGMSAANVFCDADESYYVKSGKGDVYIYGLRHASPAGFSSVSKRDEKGVHIGLFNAGFNPQAERDHDNLCIGKDDIKKMNLDFYAMGGDHGFRVFKLSNRIIGAFAGSPEPCTAAETGDRFAVSFEVENGSIQNIKRVAVNTVRILCEEVDCTGLLNESELSDKIKSSFDRENCYILTLTGVRDFILDSLKTELAGFFRRLDLVDYTRPNLGIMLEELSAGENIQSFFFRSLAGKIDGAGCSPSVIARILNRGSSGRRIFCDF